MRVLTVNTGSHSVHVTLVEDGRLGESLDLDARPEETGDRVAGFVAEFVAESGGRRGVDAVGHRLVHGADVVVRPTVATDEVLAAVRRVADLDPLHVPPALDLVDRLRESLPDVPHVLCPDTAFHAGLPEVAATFPLPADWRERWGLRRYGFHGLSYAWAVRRAAALLERPLDTLHLVVAHLGGGASVCAVRDGRSVDTSMGLTALDGVPMSTRSGAVDPGMLLWLLDGRLDRAELADGLYHQSGLLGLSRDRSGDTRDLVAAAGAGDADAALALAVYAHRVRREIAAAATSLDRLDALVFTGEIGWDQPEVRHDVCAGLRLLGVRPPVRGNRDDDGPVSDPHAAVPVLVVETGEEYQLADDTLAALAE